MEKQKLLQLEESLRAFISNEIEDAVDNSPISVDFNKKDKHGFHFMRTYKVHIEGDHCSCTYDTYDCFDLSKSLYNIIDVDDFNDIDENYYVVFQINKDRLKSTYQMKQGIEKGISRQRAIDAEMERHNKELEKLESRYEK